MNERIHNLKTRSDLLRRMRGFFYERDFIEVETPLLSDEVIPELHIEPLALSRDATHHTAYLQASPELHMKHLLGEGIPAMFQVTRSFRTGESGRLHNPEFSLAEWYRAGDDMSAGMTLLDELVQTLLGTLPARRISYREAFQSILDICPYTASCEQLATCAERNSVSIPSGMPVDGRDEWLNLLLSVRIEPLLGQSNPDLLYDYPASQSALAKLATREDGVQVAERFELYWNGIELANGYHELTDANELRERLAQVNFQRNENDRSSLPMPESLLAAMERGMPACSGCALGFDRLVMLAVGAESIEEVMTFCDRN